VLWLQAAREHPEGRVTALRYAAGISALLVLWLVRLLVAELDVLSGTALDVVFLALVMAELAVPVWAERSRSTSWHPHHIAERCSLFTIIMLGVKGVRSSREVGARTPGFRRLLGVCVKQSVAGPTRRRTPSRSHSGELPGPCS
jgi:low temperature requirement protein LtrA